MTNPVIHDTIQVQTTKEITTMKNIIITIIITCLLASTLFGTIYVATHQYEVFNIVSATVCEVNEEAVAFEDASGEVWVWELEEGESFELGQQVQIQFNDMATADIYDDEIIRIF